MFDNKDNAISKHDNPIGPVTGMLNNEIKENIPEEKSDDVLRKQLSASASRKWTVCRTTPSIFCYHITEKGLQIQMENNDNIGKGWLLLKRHFARTT